MTIRCPRKECNMKMYVEDSILSNPNANVKCPSCKNMFKPFDTLSKVQQEDILAKKKPKVSQEIISNPKQNLKEVEVVGWLVVHDENTHTQTYELKEGKQLIGRKSETLPCDIMIETKDTYMSRNHFILTVKRVGTSYSYLIEDSHATNKTYVDTRRISQFEREMKQLKPNEQIYIEDGALIQAGHTKIVLKTLRTVSNKEDATRIVSQEKITKTIVL